MATDGEAAYPALDADARRALARARRLELNAALRAQGLDDVDVHWLGLPDSGLEGCAAALRTALRPLLADADAYLAPWDGDPHPDHRAVGLAAADVAPVTAHGWALPDLDVGVAQPGRPRRAVGPGPQCSGSTPRSLAAKRADLAAFTSQVGPRSRRLSAGAGRRDLAHTARPAELLFRVAPHGLGTGGRHAELYADGADPWRAGSWYERRKRAVVLASLPRERYRRAFEPGCGDR